MDNIFSIVLVLHIAGGTVGLLTGTVNLFRRKGDRLHKLVGLVFYFAMLTAGFSSLALAVLHPNQFLFMVGVFTLYLTHTGRRYLYMQRTGVAQKLQTIDWITTAAMLLSGLLFVGIGIWTIVNSNFFGSVYVTFGIIGLLMVMQDIRNYRGSSKTKNYGLISHIGRMTGAYIASLTAFLVVNAAHSPIQLPAFLVWLLPTAIIVPYIVRWSRKYEIKKVMK